MSASTFCPVSRTLGHRPEELLPAIPYLLGYTPIDSLVCLFFDEGGHMRLSSRVDWGVCRLAAEDVVTTLAQRARNSGGSRVLLAAVDPADPDLAVVGELAAHFLTEGFRLDWAGHCYGSRWRGLECTPRCDEHVMDRHCATVVRLIADGMAPVRDREAVVAEVAADANPLRERDLPRQPAEGIEREEWRDALIHEATQLLAGRRPVSRTDAGKITAACLDVRVRDVLLWRLTNAADGESLRSERTWEVFRDSLRLAPQEAVAAVGAVSALVAWQRGEGTRAMECLHRARESDPHHSLAALVFRCVDSAQPPSLWLEVMAGLDEKTCRHGNPTGPSVP